MIIKGIQYSTWGTSEEEMTRKCQKGYKNFDLFREDAQVWKKMAKEILENDQ